ncbi:hypothetical protein EXIGLDRAFT_729192 [Exidia glandulosa HHB12029]|uniref:Uncharacterized protein n=1 Tax=Exidia glandulosa HHB12029 TaxID=1314781 RepID=A0A165LLT9_EXIGL|nr:hypothetical protein EXIGLDRAFT_729192 [Exidia glandulosa HHB12029]
MVDVLAAKNAGWDLTPNLLEYLGRVLNSIGSLRHILLRPRCLLLTFTAERFYSVVEEWAAAARDPRIWVEDSGPSWINHDGSHIHEELHVQDAVVGDELWLRGRQLYLPSVPAPLANEQ